MNGAMNGANERDSDLDEHPSRTSDRPLPLRLVRSDDARESVDEPRTRDADPTGRPGASPVLGLREAERARLRLVVVDCRRLSCRLSALACAKRHIRAQERDVTSNTIGETYRYVPLAGSPCPSCAIGAEHARGVR